MKTIQKLKEVIEFKDFSVKLIFQNHWEDYLKTHKVRDVELREVGKMLSCKGMERGCFVYSCKNCGKNLIFCI